MPRITVFFMVWKMKRSTELHSTFYKIHLQEKAMLKNYFNIFLRNFKKSPVYVLINIFGLALGMTVSILIFLFVQHELSYDQYHEKADKIYRVSRSWTDQNGEISLHLGHAAPPFAPLLKSDFGAVVQESVRLMSNNPLVKYQGNSFTEERFYFGDPEVFKVFSWTRIDGDLDNALTFPDGLVITASTAKRYFGNEDPMGKSMQVVIGDNTIEMQVRGIVEDVPDNSHFKFDILASMKPVEEFYGGLAQMMQNFGSNNFSTFLLLNDGADFHELENQLPAFIDRHMSPNSEGIPASKGTQLKLWPLKDIHLHSNLDSEMEPNSSIEYVYIYLAIALFILLIACINFMNLSTARSSKRAMEVGLRKVMGADKELLIRQFMGESIFMAFVALAFALILVYLTLPIFSDFTDKDLHLDFLEHPAYLFWIVILVIFVGLISGSYPALFLSGFEPVKVMKGTYKIGSIHEKLRSILVVGQFAISIVLIVCVIVVINQLDYMKSKDLGFEKEGILVLPAYTQLTDNFEMMRERLKKQPGILEVSLASRIPSGRLLDSQGTKAEVGGELSPINIRIADVHVSHTFKETFGMKMVAGRNFDFNLASDSTQAFILNETAIRAIGWSNPEEAVDKQIEYGGRRGYVVGVLKDFHFESLHQPIVPIIFMIPENRFGNVAIKIQSDRKEEIMEYLRGEWMAMRPDSPVEFTSVEDQFLRQYEAEERIGTIFGFFAMLAILISVLGLFGLTAYATEQRTKEIGIRKVMGASVFNIVTLLGKDFLKLVLLGFLISIPIAWYGMDQWLGGFAYGISVSWVVFLIAGLSASLIALVTVSSQSIKAAMINPVDSFRVD
ncbi:hypothetical protein P872_15770 [Rhodonellum psychrophilum GCM71 = DSM 17998]|uniref:ABC transporter permease n=3 Tax=Cytophagaceae TaxID=89373 RepID=U5C350_9BACT|nr:hypothetical protein P872_15770 [Rhodonellum psychrophilum GCM71 = DSM 17998]SDZ18496.1 putative ABC transport system permease protein [Rhodonellum ikkaensis]